VLDRIRPTQCCTRTATTAHSAPMDINSLLSPSESPASEASPPLASPSPRSSPNRRHVGRPTAQQRKSSGLSQQITLDSPRTSEQSLPSLAALNATSAYQQQQQQQQQGVYGQAVQGASFQQQKYGATPVHGTSAASTPETRAATSLPSLSRQGSTPGMDTLAGTWSNTCAFVAWMKNFIKASVLHETAAWLTPFIRSCIDATRTTCCSPELRGPA
jgi:hypothetical protein